MPGELPARMARLGFKRPLVVTDAGVLETDAFRALARVLGEANRNRRWFLYSGVHPNPVESDVVEVAQVLRDSGCDGVIAIGGGSPLDAGKAAALVAVNAYSSHTRRCLAASFPLHRSPWRFRALLFGYEAQAP